MLSREELFGGKRVAVIGAARTGTAVARALVPLGAKVVVYDGKPISESIEAKITGAGARVVSGNDTHPDIGKADILIPSPGVWKTHPALIAASDAGVPVWSEIEVAFRLSRAPIIAVTGTNGKTTTTALIGALLEDSGIDARVGGNIAPGRPLIDIAVEAPENAVLVAEVSSFQLEWIDTFCPKVGVLTNITPDHLDRHGTLAGYALAKTAIFRNQTSADHAVVNADNDLSLKAGQTSRGTLWRFSTLVQTPLGAHLSGDEMVLRDRDGDHPVMDARKIRMVGSHNRENALAAVLAAKIMGGNPDNFVHTLTRFPGVPHRMEWVASANGVDFINNSMCTNPEAFARSIEACERPVVLIAGGRNKGLSFEGSVDVMARWCRAVVTIGEHGPALAELARRAEVPVVVEAGELEPAVEIAVGAARTGDVLLLAPGCASMDQFKDFMERGDRFKTAVRSFTEGAGR